MRVAVVYESLFGNTRQIAESIAEGVAEAGGAARCWPVSSAGDAEAGVDLLVLGGPTHYHAMTSPRSRDMGGQSRLQRDPARGGNGNRRVGARPGVRERLGRLPAGRGAGAAAFDTRLSTPLAGGAALYIARGLFAHGYWLVASPEGFLVAGTEGPLLPGERDRARRWGHLLVACPPFGRSSPPAS